MTTVRRLRLLKRRASSKTLVLPSKKTVSPSRINCSACRAIASFSSLWLSRRVSYAGWKLVLDILDTAPPCERTRTPSPSNVAKSRRIVIGVTLNNSQSSTAAIVRRVASISRIRNLRSSASKSAPLSETRETASRSDCDPGLALKKCAHSRSSRIETCTEGNNSKPESTGPDHIDGPGQLFIEQALA